MNSALECTAKTPPAYGLFPAGDFRLTTGAACAGEDSPTSAPALWYFRAELIAVPCAGKAVAGFDARRRLADDLRDWVARTPAGSARDYPPLVWVASPQLIEAARLDADGRTLRTAAGVVDFTLAPRLASNRSFCNADSLAYLAGRELRLRGDWAIEEEGGARRFVARCLWPSDFRVDPAAPLQPVAANALAIRDWMRSSPDGGARGAFVSRPVWQREAQLPVRRAGRPFIAIMLNGAQGDDDEAHGGHFGLCTGRLGANGEFHDALIANFYTLDSESEKGIIAAMLPLDGYLADVNSGQAWYRPSYLLLATLRDERTARHLSSALARVFNQFYRHQFAYHHASANCTGISLSTLRALGWRVPRLGASSWLKAIAALPWVGVKTCSLKQGRAAFDYLSEERSCLLPALAFEQAAADLLQLVAGQARRALTPYEALLAQDVEEILLLRIPQLPSSRAWGSHPVVSLDEYEHRLPRDPAQRQIVPVDPRPFPERLRDPATPRPPLQRSTYALLACAAGATLLLAGAWRWLAQSSADRRAKRERHD